MTHYGISTSISLSFDDAIDRVTTLLSEEKFGILMRINVDEKIHEKLGKDMDRYTILGACRPSSAYEAIQHETEIGLLLPCNVLVYEKDGKVFVSAVRPSIALGIVDNPNLKCLATDIEDALGRVIKKLSS